MCGWNTATTIGFVRGQSTSSAVQIDHMVALSDAWQKGAQQFDPATRQNPVGNVESADTFPGESTVPALHSTGFPVLLHAGAAVGLVAVGLVGAAVGLVGAAVGLSSTRGSRTPDVSNPRVAWVPEDQINDISFNVLNSFAEKGPEEDTEELIWTLKGDQFEWLDEPR